MTECNSCGFEAKCENYPSVNGEDRVLCYLCASTMAGKAYEEPRNFPAGMHHTLSTICFVGNAILAAIREGKADA